MKCTGGDYKYKVSDTLSISVDDLYDLANIVFMKHFAFVGEADRMDYVQEAVLKAISLIEGKVFDPSRGSLRNYLYTGMRNQMTNYRYSFKREIPAEEIFAESDDNEEINTYLDIPLDDVRSVLIRFPKYQPLACYIVGRLSEMGFLVGGVCLRDPVPEEYQTTVERLVTLVLWARKEYYR